MVAKIHKPRVIKGITATITNTYLVHGKIAMNVQDYEKKEKNA